MVRRIGAGLAVSALLAACGSPRQAEKSPAGETPRAEASPDGAADDVLVLMQTVVEPGAEAFWGSAGWVIDADGERSLRPTTEQGWAEVVAGAAAVAQAGDLLLTPPYTEGRDQDWRQFAGALAEIGRRAAAAAEARDEERIFDVGAIMYRVCDGCHLVYVDPDAAAGPMRLPDAVEAALGAGAQ